MCLLSVIIVNSFNTIIITISLPKIGPGSFQKVAVKIGINSSNPELVLLLSMLDVFTVGNGQLHFCNINK